MGDAPELRQMWSPPTYTEEFLRQGLWEYRRTYYIQCHRRANNAIDRDQLREAFVNFDNLIRIAIASEEATPENNRLLELTGLAPHPYWYRSGAYVIPCVIASLKDAKAKIRCLEIDTGQSERHFWDEKFSILLYAATRMSTQSLSLVSKSFASPKSGYGMVKTKYHTLVRCPQA